MIDRAARLRALAEAHTPVVDGVVNYLSVSAITTADTRMFGGCLLRWWFKYVAGEPEPSKRAQDIGKVVHGEIKHYLQTGELVLGNIAMAARPFIPDPGPGLLVEWEISGTPQFAIPTLESEGIPLVGSIDLVNFRPDWIDPNGEPLLLPPDYVEVEDWKTTSSFDYAKSAAELSFNVQMIGYAEWAMRTWPQLEGARLSHTYIHTGRREAIKRSVLVTRDEIRGEWESTASVTRRIVQAAKQTRPEDVEANTRACSAFGGCPHRAKCPAAQNTSLTRLFGDHMSLMNTLNLAALGIGVPAAAPAPMPTVQPIAPAAGVGVGISMDPHIAALQADERRLAAQYPVPGVQPAPPPPPAAPAIPAEFVEAVRFLKTAPHGYGFPTVRAAAGDMVAAVCGWAVPPGTVHNGEGHLRERGVDIADPAQIVQLAGELAKLPPFQAPAPVAPPAPAPMMPSMILPPDAPASNPNLAAMPFPAPAAVAPPAAQFTAVALAPPTQPVPVVAAAGTEEPAKKKRGRPPKNASANTAPAANVPHTPASGETSDTFELFVDCIPSIAYEDMRPHVDSWVELIRGKLQANSKDAIVDIRTVENESPAAYGKWKGIISGLIRAVMDSTHALRGTYYLDTRGSEFADIAADTLKPYATALGVYARSAR